MLKKVKKVAVLMLSLVLFASVAVLAACNKEPATNTDYYTVTFMVEGEQYGETKQVRKNARVAEPEEPEFSNDGYIFTGWYKTNEFKDEDRWNFATDIVTSNLTLYAGYREVFEYVADVAMAAEAHTSKIVWSQKAVSDAADYEVTITNEKNVTSALQGTVGFDQETFKVTFTPTAVPQGGRYTVSVKDTNYTADAATLEGAVFGGAGTESNPYLVASALDFTAVNRRNVDAGTFFRLFSDITIETSRADQSAYTFNGTLIGNGKVITLENSNCAAIYKIGADGYVYNVNVAGNVSSGSYDSIGTIADFNEGKVEKITVTANVTSTGGLVGSSGLDNALNASLADGEGKRGIAGGVVGTNAENGEVVNCKIVTESSATGTVKARIGGGCIVGLNYGKIESCIGEGCFGAWNSTESGGKSLSTYSYSGGIAGINAGVITKCSVSGSGKVLAQRYTDESLVVAGTNNSNLGGIVGYNMKNASVSECSFSGIRVHGDENIGGIAGQNAGTIADCYAEGVYSSTTEILSYVGGRTNVGGIVGLDSEGSVARCFSTVNVYSFKSNTGYSLAENATDSVYLSENPNETSQRDKDTGASTNPAYAALTAPAGTGNVAVANTKHEYDKSADNAGKKGENFLLAEDYLTTLGAKFYFNDDAGTVKLTYEQEILPEQTITVHLYYGVTLWNTIQVPETPASISAPVKYNHVLSGWSLSAGGEIKFAADKKFSVYDLFDYADEKGEVSLYAQYKARTQDNELVVAVWSRYIDASESDAIEAAFKTAVGSVDYTITFKDYAPASASGDAYYAIADFGAAVAADGNVDVVIGGGATMNAGNGFEYLHRAKMTYEGFTDRYAALMTDSPEAVDFYSYITDAENNWAEVTLSVGGKETKDELSSLIGNEMEIPAIEIPDGKVLAGWSLTENGTVDVFAGSITYAAVSSVLSEGKAKLYPVFEDAPNENAEKVVVAIWTNWVTSETKQSIISGFTAYLTEQGVNLADYNIEYRDYDQTAVADLGAATNADGDVDIIVGCGGNVDTKGGVEIIEKATTTFSGITTRYVARLTDSAIAVHLYAFLTAQA